MTAWRWLLPWRAARRIRQLEEEKAAYARIIIGLTARVAGAEDPSPGHLHVVR